MHTISASLTQEINFTRYNNHQQGHYESFFQRANHPSRPLAFWIRYTIFSPKNRPQDAVGELWAVYFNGETNQHVVLKNEVPLQQCTFSSSAFFIQIGESQLQPEQLSGLVKTQENSIAWDAMLVSTLFNGFTSYLSRHLPFLLLASKSMSYKAFTIAYTTIIHSG